MAKTIKTRICIISDTHTNAPMPESSTEFAYREPLPKADVLLHAGDLTKTGFVWEYQIMLDVLRKAEAEIKIVIAGNHDISLDEGFYNEAGKWLFHRGKSENLLKVKEMWTGRDAKQAGIIYVEEGTRTFRLNNGVTFTVSCFYFISILLLVSTVYLEDAFLIFKISRSSALKSNTTTDILVTVAARVLLMGV